MKRSIKQRIEYGIAPKDLAGHLFAVTLTVDQPAPDGQMFALPSWIPGSYMIREFARNIVQIRAECGDQPVALEKLNKDSWRAAPCSGQLTLSYEVYAWDLSVRAAHLDQTHGFFNASSLCLRVIGQEHRPHLLVLRRPDDPAGMSWRIATTLPEWRAAQHGFGSYLAADYDELIDHPVEMGNFALASFKAHGVLHEIAITGKVPNLDLARITTDLKKICEAQIALFEPRSLHAPMERYLFLVMAVGDGYGGLEHRSSTALLCARNDLPVKGQAETSAGYRTFLGLCSHEYFHTWNVKRIKPAAFVPYHLQAENYTHLLWLFEGFTSYYDDLMLARSGVIERADYLKRLERLANNVLRGAGRFKQSVAEASFDAWIKYYRQDENSPNALVSYYTKGALVALALDLTMRAKTDGQKSLDDVMRALWQRYGHDFYTAGATQRGVSEAEVEALIEEISGLKLKRFFDRYVRGTDDLPLTRLLSPFGLAFSDQRKRQTPSLEVRIASAAARGSECQLAQVYAGGAAHVAGLSANDVLIALDGLRVTSTNLDSLLARYAVGEQVVVHAFRRDELMTFNVKLQSDQAPQAKLQMNKPSAASAKLLDGWLVA
ncbi:MAG: PDZ domain-containing protein [Burkholderiaceae bacterium]|nr:PDZ domain-containing protein [Burkholderiaceae bacterium]